MEMNFKDWLLSEMPITNFNLVGKWAPEDRKYGYNKQDIGILTNPKAVEKIHRKWSNSKENFDLYFVRAPKAHTFQQVGLVTPQWVKENLNLDIPGNEDTITVIFTNNRGAEKIPMTSWTMAHRIGHAINKDKIFDDYFQKEMIRDFTYLIKDMFPGQNLDAANKFEPFHLAMNAGTMKSVRDNNLRNFYEFMYECVAQYLTTSKGIHFKPIGRQLIMRQRFAWGKPNHDVKWIDADMAEHINGELEGLADKYNHYLDTVFMGLLGQIFVM